MYLYPMFFTDELIDRLAGSQRIIPYLDMPLQHINDEVLRRMKRATTRAKTEDLLSRLRQRIPGLVMRTTLMAGFPGETQAQFDGAAGICPPTAVRAAGGLRLLSGARHAGGELDGQLPERVRKRRRDQLLAVQQEIAFAWAEAQQGRRLDVLIDAAVPDQAGAFVGRSYADAPEVDGVVYVPARGSTPGQIVPCEIVATRGYDLVGVAVDGRGEGGPWYSAVGCVLARIAAYACSACVQARTLPLPSMGRGEGAPWYSIREQVGYALAQHILDRHRASRRQLLSPCYTSAFRAQRLLAPIFNLPNQLTSLRILLAVIMFALIDRSVYWASFVLFVIAAGTDWLDGYFARKYGLVTTLGRILDPFADKVIVCGTFIYLVSIPATIAVPWGLRAWMVVVMVGRELLVTALRSFFGGPRLRLLGAEVGQAEDGLSVHCRGHGAVRAGLPPVSSGR